MKGLAIKGGYNLIASPLRDDILQIIFRMNVDTVRLA
jgi:hypothetical protein